MDPGTEDRTILALLALRVTVALLLAVHGVARLVLGIVDDFGQFLDGAGLPFGTQLAWTITLMEIVGGGALAAGVLVRTLCLWFTVQLIAGIVLVHAPNGWFVVGSGRNGVEYSALLMVCLGVIALSRRRVSS